MKPQMMKAACGAVALCAWLAAYAQTAASAPATPLRYTSAFADYQAWQDSPPGDWRRLNDALGARAAIGMPMPMPMSTPTPTAGAASAAAAGAATVPKMPPMKQGKHAGHGGQP